MPTPDPLVTIRRMFEAFRAGDLDALIATVHPDSEWTYIGANPRRSRAHFRGREAVRAFFERILRRLDMRAFTATDTVVDGQTVVVFGFEEGEIRSTRAGFRNEWVQKYVVEDGLIVEMVELNVQVEPAERDTRPATGTGATALRSPS